MSFLGDFETAVTAFLGTVATAGGGLVAIFQAAFVAGFSIWIMLIAYDVAWGRSDDGLSYLMKKIFRMFIIGVIALYGFPQLADLLTGVKDGLVVGLSGAPNISNILDTNLITPLKNFYDVLWQWPDTGFSLTDLASPLTLIQKVLYYLFLWLVFVVLVVIVVIVSIVALSMFLVALTCFSLLMAVGPFFLLCLAFPFLQRFFETYIGNVVTACLGMAFTALLVTIVAGLLNITAIAASLTVTTDYLDFRTIVVVIAGKIGSAALLIYMFYKVFDLAAALGGGLNMGNNLVAGARALTHDAARSMAGPDRGMARAGGGGANQISQGRSGGSTGGGGQAGGRNRGSAMQQIARNRTFSGMAATAAVLGTAGAARMIGRTASATAGEARVAGRGFSAGANAVGHGAAVAGAVVGRGVMAMGAGAARAARALRARRSK
jgi:type IV secretion system protein VirB6